MVVGVTYDGYRPGALASVLKLHTDYYHKHWNFGLSFELKVASELAKFLGRTEQRHDMFLSAYTSDGQLHGSITIDSSRVGRDGAHLRWFIVSPDSAGHGIGQELMSRAITHCDQLKFEKVFLTTFEGLESARRLYDRWGFQLESERRDDQWNGGVIEQRYVRLLPE